jgi:putative Holliday junction resolvase
MRIVGLDVGERRIGVAVSDVTRTLARPIGVLQSTGLDDDAPRVAAAEVARLAGEEDGRRFAAELGRLTDLPVTLQDERLTSREAEDRLAVREKDWRARKARLDAAAAAIILQEYLDRL